MFIIYDILFFVFALLYLPYVIIRRKWHQGFSVRLGVFPSDLKVQMGKGKSIWIHAVSVGEVMAVLGLIGKIQEKYPQRRIVLTTVTQTGFKLAQERLVHCQRNVLTMNAGGQGESVSPWLGGCSATPPWRGSAEGGLAPLAEVRSQHKNLSDGALGPEIKVIYAPLDFSLTVQRFIGLIQPEIYITAETEIWPNLFYALQQRNIPVILVNGRISDQAFGRYRFFKFLFGPRLRQMNAVCTQTEIDAQRFMILGARSTCVFVTGNFKFDEVKASAAPAVSILNYPAGQLVWVAGSTHPGEDQVVLETFRILQKEFPGLRLILAPRHVERSAAVKALVDTFDFSCVSLSEVQDAEPKPEVIVVDSIGHLRDLYRVADIVFIGKSLVGQGGQNILEPAFFAKPIVVGPHMQNFRKIVEIFLAGNALVQVQDPTELLSAMRELLSHPQHREQLGAASRQLIERNQGATQKAFDIICRFLPQ